MAFSISDDQTLCHCGKQLHYSDREIERFVRRIVRTLGEHQRVTVGVRTWLVPRHYVALHGLNSQELPTLGFEEVTANA